MLRVLVTDPIHADGIELFKKEKNIQVTIDDAITQKKLAKTIHKYDGLVIRSRNTLSKDLFKKAVKLKVIGRVGIDVSHIAVEQASRQGIVIVNSPRGNVIATAEHTIGLILALLRNIIPAHQELQQGNWKRVLYEGQELAGKNLGIIGLGKIGSEVSWRAKAFNMSILAYDPFVTQEYAEIRYANLVNLDKLLSESDIITIHAPLTDLTKKMINKKSISKMKNGVFFVNCGHGGIVEEKALATALKQKKIKAAAIDVFSSEPAKKKNPLIGLSNVITTPHLGGDTNSAKQKSTIDVCQGVIDVLAERSPQFPVNLPLPLPSDLEYYKPYLLLTQQLGCFAKQICQGSIGNLEFTYAGEIAKKNTALLKANFLLSFLKCGGVKKINLVNAFYLAQDRGIRIAEKKTKEAHNFNSLFTVKITTSQEKQIISGTVMRNQPHLVQLNDFWIDIIPEGHILVTSHNDQPGVIGALGTLLGKNKINIASMEVGRSAPGKNAIMVTTLDSEPSNDILKQIQTLPHIMSVKKIKL